MNDGRRAIFIDARNKTVEEIVMPTGKAEDDWRRIREKLECTYIDRVGLTGLGLNGRETLWIDDEGLLVQPNPIGYFAIRSWDGDGRVSIIAGHGLILGTTNIGTDTDSELDVDLVRANVRFLGYEDLGPEQLEPKHVLTTWDADGNEVRQEYAVPVTKLGEKAD